MIDPGDPCVVVVSESPEFIVAAQEVCRGVGVRMVACLGPAHSPCVLERSAVCPLAAESTVAVVDAPESGSFTCHWKSVPAGEYAERLARLHRDALVLLCGLDEGIGGPTGDVVCIGDRRDALELLDWSLDGAAGRHSRSPLSGAIAAT